MAFLPCPLSVKQGTNAYVFPDTDLDGRPRLVGGAVDMGAYEHQGPGQGEFVAWLQQCRLPTDGSADSTDPDGDRLNNWQEWEADTNPTNAASCLCLSILPNALPVTVALSSSASRLYTLLCCTNLTSIKSNSIWTPISGQTDVPGNDAVLTLTDTAPRSPAFYRVAVRLP